MQQPFGKDEGEHNYRHWLNYMVCVELGKPRSFPQDLISHYLDITGYRSSPKWMIST